MAEYLFCLKDDIINSIARWAIRHCVPERYTIDTISLRLNRDEAEYIAKRHGIETK